MNDRTTISVSVCVLLGFLGLMATLIKGCEQEAASYRVCVQAHSPLECQQVHR